MRYAQWPTPVPGAVVWRAVDRPGTTRVILPDGCLDLLLVGDRLLVAGPDSHGRDHVGGDDIVGLRLALGRGPALLGVPAERLTDTTVELSGLWSPRAARALTGRVLADPRAALTAWAATAVDPEAARVFAAARAGLGAAEIAERAGVSARTLHRRSRAAFGYGPQHLVRVLRLQRALAAARGGASWADAASATGYADQPHLARDVRDLTGQRPRDLVQPGSGA